MVYRDDYYTLQIKPPTKSRLADFKEVAGLTYDEAINYLLDHVLVPEDNGNLAHAGLRVRKELASKDESQGNHKGHPTMSSDPFAVVVPA
jgi:hypothetical protein